MARTVSEESWAQIEELYRTTSDSEVEIARRFGIHHFAVFQRARSRGWTRLAAGPAVATGTEPAGIHEAREAAPPPAVRLMPVGAARKPRKPKALPAAEAARDELIRRLYRAIATKLTKLEERMADDQPPMAPEESERHTREIASMVQGFEKITEVHTDVEKSGAAARPLQPNITTLADIERVRRDLAQRLHRAWGGKVG